MSYAVSPKHHLITEYFPLRQIFCGQPFWKTVNELVLAESLGISVLTSAFFTLRAQGWMWRAGHCPPSARLQCPPGELVLLLQLLPWGGHLLTTPDIEEWSNSLYVSLPPPPLLLCCPLPSIQGICLVKLINLFNDAIYFLHINLGPENLPFSVLPWRGAFTHGYSLSGMGTCLGKHQGRFCGFLEFPEWLCRCTYMTFWCPEDGFSAKSIWQKADFTFLYSF